MRTALAAIEFLGVEWIGDKKPALEQIGPLLGSLLVAVVAAFAAWLAARTANERQERQLQQDSQRQRELLRHDREVRDRDFLRETISSAIETATQTMERLARNTPAAKKSAEAHAAVAEANAELEAIDRADDEKYTAALKRSTEAYKKAGEAMKAFDEHSDLITSLLLSALADQIRLGLLLGADSELTKTHASLVQSLRGINDSQNEMYVNAYSEELEQASTEAQGELKAAMGRFREACRAELIPSLNDEEPPEGGSNSS